MGETGVVGLLRSGKGPTVTLRADMGALPIWRDDTLLSQARDAWIGTLMAVFQLGGKPRRALRR